MTTEDDEPPPPRAPASTPPGSKSRSKGPREGPAWVDSFLAGEYFTNCNFHTSGKNERNMFCTDCNEGPLCQFGMITNHSGHKTLQVRKASHMDSIRVVDIQQRLEVSDIQTYSINSAKIVFLLSRPQPRPSKGAPHACRYCNRALPDDAKFCSLACKLDVLREVPEDRSITFALPEGSSEQDREWSQQQDEPSRLAAQNLHLQYLLGQQQKKGKKKRLGKRKKWTEKKGLKKKKAKLLVPRINKLLQESELSYLKGDGASCSDQVLGDSPATPEKSECSSSKSRCRKGVPRRAPLR